ncbi:hypothetical protein PoB_004735900 [Plakobranchus ocellatus]|uniref:Uncharacterized protein n=1 Tax=Plakobranchus ocellatus TaxID=259542 RepID=A0AAV4BL33_9GAST|nr:hypothetical protein PoB_004735900 [Plakobranchus ocellatus]
MTEFLISAPFLGVLPVTARNTAGHTGSAGHRVRNPKTRWTNFVPALSREQRSTRSDVQNSTLGIYRIRRPKQYSRDLQDQISPTILQGSTRSDITNSTLGIYRIRRPPQYSRDLLGQTSQTVL